MNDQKTPQGILVRKVPFEFPKDFDPHWNPTKPELSHLINAGSVLLPYMEPFIIDSIRQATQHITDPNLLKEAKAWIGQESQHFMQHRRFNDVLIAKGYPQLREREKQLEREYDALRKRPFKFQLAYTAGFETMALFVAHQTINQREYFFGNADPTISSLWLWHVSEEVEHKNVAFDAYQHLYGDYWYRMYGLIAAFTHMIGMLRPSYITMLKADGLWGTWKTRWAIKKIAFRFFVYLLPRLLMKDAMPWHHPSRTPDPAWMKEWVAMFDKGEPGLAKLDTKNIGQPSPALAPAA